MNGGPEMSIGLEPAPTDPALFVPPALALLVAPLAPPKPTATPPTPPATFDPAPAELAPALLEVPPVAVALPALPPLLAWLVLPATLSCELSALCEPHAQVSVPAAKNIPTRTRRGRVNTLGI